MDTFNVYASLVNSTSQNYSIEWLDLLITVILNPAKTDHEEISAAQFRKLQEMASLEDGRLQLIIKGEVFSLSNESKIEFLVRRYHSSLISLLDQTIKNHGHSAKKLIVINALHEAVLSCLENLLSFIETEYSQYLSMEERVPATYLAVSRSELRQRVDLIKKKAQQFLGIKPLIDIILKNLYHYTDAAELKFEVTYKTILYNKELVGSLEKLNWKSDEGALLTRLNEVLIYLNFNSKSYINYFIKSFKDQLSESGNDRERMEKLFFCYKAFNQTYRKPGLIFNPKFYDLIEVVGNWFVHEIVFMERKISLYSAEEGGEKATVKGALKVPKVMCALSSDQIGLILRAADELRIIVSKSLSEVFKTIVPYLSTPHKEDLSYKGMRTQSYVAEERDKDVAIATLERIIKKINEY